MAESFAGTKKAKAITRIPAARKSKEILTIKIDFEQINKISSIIKMILLGNKYLYCYL